MWLQIEIFSVSLSPCLCLSLTQFSLSSRSSPYLASLPSQISLSRLSPFSFFSFLSSSLPLCHGEVGEHKHTDRPQKTARELDSNLMSFLLLYYCLQFITKWTCKQVNIIKSTSWHEIWTQGFSLTSECLNFYTTEQTTFFYNQFKLF